MPPIVGHAEKHMFGDNRRQCWLFALAEKIGGLGLHPPNGQILLVELLAGEFDDDAFLARKGASFKTLGPCSGLPRIARNG